MKNLFKSGFLALAIFLSVSACNSNKTDDNMSDSSIMSDSAMIDSGKTDTLIIDTTTTM